MISYKISWLGTHYTSHWSWFESFFRSYDKISTLIVVAVISTLIFTMSFGPHFFGWLIPALFFLPIVWCWLDLSDHENEREKVMADLLTGLTGVAEATVEAADPQSEKVMADLLAGLHKDRPPVTPSG